MKKRSEVNYSNKRYMHKFKVGDKVIVNYPGFWGHGEIGTIVSMYHLLPDMRVCSVKFEKKDNLVIGISESNLCYLYSPIGILEAML